MAELSIPLRHRQPLISLLTLKEAPFGRLHLKLIRYKPLPGRQLQLSSIAKVAIPGVDDADNILLAINSLYMVWADAGDRPLDSFIDDVLGAIASFDQEVGEVRVQESRKRLHKILSIPQLASAAKAIAVFVDHQRQFHDAKILTDVRYAFKPDPSVEPFGAVIMHTLKLTYHQDGDHKHFYIALDNDDLERLKAIVERAQAKMTVLRRTVAKTRIKYLGKS